MSNAYLSLGGNIGDSRAIFQAAVVQLEQSGAVRISAKSPLYRTGAWGREEQADFLNAALAVDTYLPPLQLLELVLGIELAHGRTRELRWGARTLDIDILCYDELTLNNERLILPHPLLAERMFVLRPLADIAPDLIIPGLDTVSNLLAACPDKGWVELADKIW